MIERALYAAAAGFEAAREIPLGPAQSMPRLHGHSFVANVHATLPEGWAGFPGGEADRLREHLADVVQPLDYEFLNRKLELPTDGNLARWVRDRLDMEAVDHVGIRSTRHQGVDLDARGRARAWRRYAFDSAHRLPNVPAGHKCGRMHGHGFETVLHADQGTGSGATGVAYARLDELWAPIGARLHLACLNEIPGLENPTSEMLAGWIWHRLKPELPELSRVTVHETASCGAHFDGRHYRIWKDMTLDSSLCLKHAPESDPRRRLHGHTYTLRLHLCGLLDAVRGWTIDFGDVKTLFDPVFRRLDHQPLHEIVGDRDADPASLAGWIREQAIGVLPQLERIDLEQTRGCGAILSWGESAPALLD